MLILLPQFVKVCYAFLNVTKAVEEGCTCYAMTNWIGLAICVEIVSEDMSLSNGKTKQKFVIQNSMLRVFLVKMCHLQMGKLNKNLLYRTAHCDFFWLLLFSWENMLIDHVMVKLNLKFQFCFMVLEVLLHVQHM